MDICKRMSRTLTKVGPTLRMTLLELGRRCLEWPELKGSDRNRNRSSKTVEVGTCFPFLEGDGRRCLEWPELKGACYCLVAAMSPDIPATSQDLPFMLDGLAVRLLSVGALPRPLSSKNPHLLGLIQL